MADVTVYLCIQTLIGSYWLPVGGWPLPLSCWELPMSGVIANPAKEPVTRTKYFVVGSVLVAPDGGQVCKRNTGQWAEAK